MGDNGTSSGGGNGSVFWEVTHGSERTGIKPMALANSIKLGGARTPSLGRVAETLTFGDTVTLDSYEGVPGEGQVKIGLNAEGHDATAFDQIGVPDHPGRFRVRLRFRDEDLKNPNLVPPQERAIIEQYGKRIPSLDPNSLFLEIDVPAIRRSAPKPGEPWADMPWEISWSW